jgi:hypothetical protein
MCWEGLNLRNFVSGQVSLTVGRIGNEPKIFEPLSKLWETPPVVAGGRVESIQLQLDDQL